MFAAARDHAGMKLDVLRRAKTQRANIVIQMAYEMVNLVLEYRDTSENELLFTGIQDRPGAINTEYIHRRD